MSNLLCDVDFDRTGNERERLIEALRAALNAAEQGEDEVSIYYNNTEITWNFSDGEFFVIGKRIL